MLTEQPSVTFSYYTCARFGAESCTLELGKVAPFGQNRLADFVGIDAALRPDIETIAVEPRPVLAGVAS